jgi:TadE-like protein
MAMKQVQVDREKGQSLIEFSFMLIVILLLLVGTIDLGRAIFTYLALRDGAQEGASYASYSPTSNITARVCASSNMLQTECAAGRVNVQTTLLGAACNGHGVQVRVTYPSFTLVTPFLGAILGTQHVAISASIQDTILTPPCH